MLLLSRRFRLSLAMLTLWASAVDAATPGFVADFEGDLHGFGGGSTSYTNPASGGADDSGYLRIANVAVAGNLGTRTISPDLTGNYIADGVTGVRFTLRDVGVDDPLEIHALVGTSQLNMWQSVLGVDPPTGSWQEYSVDLSDPSQWVRTLGTGSFEDALANADRLTFRHDVAPYEQFPDPIEADFGIDDVTLTGPAAIPIAGPFGLAVLGISLSAAAALVLSRR